MGSVIGLITRYTCMFLQKLAGYFGIMLSFRVQKINKFVRPGEVNLNVGAGGNSIAKFESLDFYSPHYYKSRKHFDKARVEFDLRTDEIPKTSESVDHIYVSHVIEHVEVHHVERFFHEAHRVLKNGGVMRLAVPDSEFLWEVSQFENDFWHWRSGVISSDSYQLSGNSMSQLDYFLREVATPRLEFYTNATTNFTLSSEKLAGMDFSTAKKLITVPTFREEFPGDHITPWDFESVSKLSEKVGFSRVIRSKPNGSVSLSMQGLEFDRTHPKMSLYVDVIK